jgi:hypothetical protein
MATRDAIALVRTLPSLDCGTNAADSKLCGQI